MSGKELEMQEILLSPLPIPAYIFSYTERRFVAANDLFCEWVGYTCDQLRGLPWKSVLPPDEAALADRAIEAALNGEFPEKAIRWRFLRKDGNILTATAKIRDMQMISDQGKMMGCHLVLIVYQAHETSVSASKLFGE